MEEGSAMEDHFHRLASSYPFAIFTWAPLLSTPQAGLDAAYKQTAILYSLTQVVQGSNTLFG